MDTNVNAREKHGRSDSMAQMH